jgi:hypothetical protein
MQSPEAREWQIAMDNEYNSLLKNQTWILDKLPSHHKLVDCKWVYQVKTNPDGTVSKFKVRLVAKGFNQTHGIDFDQTFSPIVKYKSIRTVLALVVHLDMAIV